MQKNHYIKIILALLALVILFMISKVLCLVVAVIFFIYINSKNHKREDHTDMALFYQGEH
jgi:uncharacterized membrane protein